MSYRFLTETIIVIAWVGGWYLLSGPVAAGIAAIAFAVLSFIGMAMESKK